MAEGINPFSVIGNLVAPRTTSFIMQQQEAQREREEKAAEEESLRGSGRAQEAFFATLQAGVEQGLQPHEALNRAFRDQNLMSAVMSDPNLDPNNLLQGGLAFLDGTQPPATKFSSQAYGEGGVIPFNEGTGEYGTPMVPAAPPPEPYTRSAGQQTAIFDPETQTERVIGSTPTEALQTVGGLRDFSKMPESRFRELTAAMLEAKTTGDMTAVERATKAAAAEGLIDRKTELAANAGQLEAGTMPHGEFGEVPVIINKLTNEVINPIGDAAEAAASSFGYEPGQVSPGKLVMPEWAMEKYPEAEDTFIQEAIDNQALGVGPVPMGLSALGTVMEWVHPGSSPESFQTMQAQRDALQATRLAVTGLIKQDIGALNIPSSMVEEINNWKPGKTWAASRQTNRQMMQMYNILRGDLMRNYRIANDKTGHSQGEREKSKAAFSAIDHVLSRFPSLERMEQIEDMFAKGEPPGVGLTTGVEEAVEAAGVKEPTLKGPVVTTQEAFDALNSGDQYITILGGRRVQARKP